MTVRAARSSGERPAGPDRAAADPENVDHVCHWLTPDDPPCRIIRHLGQHYPAVRPVTQTLAADLARITAQPFQHTLDTLTTVAAVFAQCAIGLQALGISGPGRFLFSRRRICGGSVTRRPGRSPRRRKPPRPGKLRLAGYVSAPLSQRRS